MKTEIKTIIVFWHHARLGHGSLNEIYASAPIREKVKSKRNSRQIILQDIRILLNGILLWLYLIFRARDGINHDCNAISRTSPLFVPIRKRQQVLMNFPRKQLAVTYWNRKKSQRFLKFSRICKKYCSAGRSDWCYRPPWTRRSLNSPE